MNRNFTTLETYEKLMDSLPGGNANRVEDALSGLTCWLASVCERRLGPGEFSTTRFGEDAEAGSGAETNLWVVALRFGMWTSFEADFDVVGRIPLIGMTMVWKWDNILILNKTVCMWGWRCFNNGMHFSQSKSAYLLNLKLTKSNRVLLLKTLLRKVEPFWVFEEFLTDMAKLIFSILIKSRL